MCHLSTEYANIFIYLLPVLWIYSVSNVFKVFSFFSLYFNNWFHCGKFLIKNPKRLFVNLCCCTQLKHYLMSVISTDVYCKILPSFYEMKLFQIICCNYSDCVPFTTSNTNIFTSLELVFCYISTCVKFVL